MKRDILAAVADGAMTTHPSRPAGRGSKRRRDTLEFGVKLLFLLCGCVAVGCVLFICIYLIVAGLPAVLEIGITDFLFGTEWAGKQGQFGILPFILTSVADHPGRLGRGHLRQEHGRQDAHRHTYQDSPGSARH